MGAAAAALMLALGAAQASAAAPTVTVEDASNVQYTSAEVAGTVDSGGQNTGWRFEYITDEQFQENVAHSQPGFSGASVPLAGSTSSTEAVGGTIFGLHAGTTYHLRLYAKNVNGFDTAVAANFTTAPVAPPVVSEVEATEVEYATFATKGKVEISGSDPGFTATTCRFEVASQQQWEESGNAFPEGPFENSSEEPLVGNCHPPGEPYSGIEPSGPGTTEVEASFNGPQYSPYNPPPYIRIKAGTTYHLRLVAGNQSGAPTMQEGGSTFETKPVAKPAVSGLSASSITATSAHISATVAPNAPTPVTDAVRAGYNVHWFITCVPDCGRPEGEIQAGEPATEVSADLGLQPNLHYTVTLHAINAGGDETSQVPVTTPPVAPEVEYPFSGSVIDRTTTDARLVGLVNPHNSQLTDCHFDYGATTSYGGTVPCTGTPTGNGFTFVSAEIGALQPATTYHFRLVAGDATGPAVGSDQEFKTFPIVSPPACGNEAVRAEQHAQALPECRAWEMASPLDKNGGNITGEGSNVVAATDGNAVEFVSRAGFADTKGTGAVGLTQYVANRGGDGWATHGISPDPNPGVFQTLFSRDEAGVFSEDLSKAVMWGYDLPDATEDIPHETNIYQEDTSTGALRTVTLATQMPNPPFFPQYINTNSVGASADVEVISFPSSVPLLPNVQEGVENVYEWDNGTLRLAGILPDGTVPSEGSSLPEAAGFYRYRESVSSNGSRVAFLSRKEGWPQLYLRRDHTSTAWVSEAEGTGVTAAENVRLQWMSPDGKYLLFTTTSQLLPSDSNGNSDLYLYTDGPNPPAESNLELISGAGHAAEREPANAVLGASDDASRIYYLSEECGCGLYELNYWHQGVVKRLTNSNYYGSYLEWGATSYPGEARVSRNGLDLAILSEKQLTGDQTNGHREMYVYDVPTESMTCASCMPSGSTDAEVPKEPRATFQGLTKEMPQVRPHWLSDDGRHVFFTTSAPLVSSDTNGLPDVYSYNTETGERRLLSSGKGEEGAWFENASDSGSDVFFVTNQHLVGKDTDQLWDIYDARVEGGFPEPPPPPTSCTGDGCRGSFSGATEVSSPATGSFSGPGNPHPKRKKPHHKRHKHRKHHRHQRGHGKRRNGVGK